VNSFSRRARGIDRSLRGAGLRRSSRRAGFVARISLRCAQAVKEVSADRCRFQVAAAAPSQRAERSGQAVAAWIGQAALDVPRCARSPRPVRSPAGAHAAGLIRSAGQLLNLQVARLHATSPGPALERANAYILKVIGRLDDAALDVQDKL
jgi:hypothetical protein